jgi:hypothetical protein
MLQLAYVDGDFSLAERELITMVSEKLGFSKEELEMKIKQHNDMQK